jgi:signal recognition particle subunit SRP54
VLAFVFWGLFSFFSRANTKAPTNQHPQNNTQPKPTLAQQTTNHKNHNNKQNKTKQVQVRRYITIIESMTEKELDATNAKIFSEPARVARLARGSGRGPYEVMNLVEAYKHYGKYATQALKATGMSKAALASQGRSGGRGLGDAAFNPRHMQQTLQRMQGALPPALLKQMGGVQGLQALMKGMEQMK